jgi:hypothetical protein
MLGTNLGKVKLKTWIEEPAHIVEALSMPRLGEK